MMGTQSDGGGFGWDGTKVPKFMSVHIVIKLFTFFLSTRYICTGVHMFTFLHIAHSKVQINVPND